MPQSTYSLFTYYAVHLQTILCVHNQSLRNKENRGRRKECNYLEYHHLAFSYYFEAKQERASNGMSSVTKS